MYYWLYQSIQLYLLRLRNIQCKYIICQLPFLLITIIPGCSLGKNIKIYAEKIHTTLVAIYELECSVCACHIWCINIPNISFNHDLNWVAGRR